MRTDLGHKADPATTRGNIALQKVIGDLPEICHIARQFMSR
jgi:hypothetical protein